MTAQEQAQEALGQLKEAVVAYLADHPEGCSNVNVADALGLRSDFEGRNQDNMSWSILGLLVNENRVRYEKANNRRRYFAS